MRSRPLRLHRGAGLALAVFLAGSLPATAADHVVALDGTIFDPSELTITEGDRVIWVNTDVMTHTVTSGTSCTPNGLFNSGNMAPNVQFEFTFNDPGDFRYFCIIHCAALMRGRIIVEEAPTPVKPSTPSAVLSQNFPNPFNPRTTIPYTLSGRARAVLSIYDAQGGLVTRFDQGVREAGTYRVEWDGRDAAGAAVGSGVYFYRLEGVAGVAPRKMLLLK